MLGVFTLVSFFILLLFMFGIAFDIKHLQFRLLIIIAASSIIGVQILMYICNLLKLILLFLVWGI
ncbi:MAG: hypothetical protein ACRCVJ_16555 [Clostridium sp.]